MGLTNDINIFSPPVLQVPKSAIIMSLPDHNTTKLTKLQVEALYVPLSRVTHNDDTRGRLVHVSSPHHDSESSDDDSESADDNSESSDDDSESSDDDSESSDDDSESADDDFKSSDDDSESSDDDSESSDDDSESADDDFKYNNDDSECGSTSALYYIIKYLFKH